VDREPTQSAANQTLDTGEAASAVPLALKAEDFGRFVPFALVFVVIAVANLLTDKASVPGAVLFLTLTSIMLVVVAAGPALVERLGVRPDRGWVREDPLDAPRLACSSNRVLLARLRRDTSEIDSDLRPRIGRALGPILARQFALDIDDTGSTPAVAAVVGPSAAQLLMGSPRSDKHVDVQQALDECVEFLQKEHR